MSARQGEELARLLERWRSFWNTPWDGGAALVTSALPVVELPGGMRITLLAPEPDALQRLARRWDREREKWGPSEQEQLGRATSARPEVEQMEPEGSIEGAGLEAAEPDEELEGDRVRSEGERPTVFVSYSREDRNVAERIEKVLLNERDVDFWFDRDRLALGERFEDSIRQAIEQSRAALVLVSPKSLESEYVEEELRVLVERARTDKMQIYPILLEPCDFEKSPIGQIKFLNDVDRPLSSLDPKEQEEELRRIASHLGDLLSASRRGADRERLAPLDIEALANAPFRPDTSEPNAASLAFFAERGDASLLFGGDAPAAVLNRSLAKLADERGVKRLSVGAFVVPHGGSERNTDAELLRRISCSRYLLSNSGRRYRRPSAKLVARILVFGRPEPDTQLELVFNYRSQANAVWEDAALMDRYRYRAIYPEPGSEGIRLRL